MEATTRRYAAVAGAAGAMLWLIANVGITFGEIEYRDPTRPNPFPDWVVPAGILAGALLIGLFAWFSRALAQTGRYGAGRAIILVGAAISFVAVWPFIFLGPLLVAIGFFVLAVSAWRAGRRSPGVALHAFGLPLSLPSGIAFDALGDRKSVV